MISYEPLWRTMKEKGVTQYSLIKTHHISAGQLSRLRNNSHVSTHTLDLLCNILNCNIEDIVAHINDASSDLNENNFID